MIKSSLRYFFLVVGAVVFAYPFLWMLVGSIKPELEINSLSLWSSQVSLHSYEQVLTKIPIGRAFLNSLIVSLSTTASVVLFGSMVGMPWRGSGFSAASFCTPYSFHDDDSIPDYVDPAIHFNGEARPHRYVHLVDRADDDDSVQHHRVPPVLHEFAASVDRCRTHRRLFGTPDSVSFDLAAFPCSDRNRGNPYVHGELERRPLAV